MTVFVTQQPIPNKHNWTPDLTPAAQYGKLQYVFNQGPLFNEIKSAQRAAEIALKHFDPETDYVCWPCAGDPAALYVIIMTLMKLGHRKINYLYWSRKLNHDGVRVRSSGEYLPIPIEV